MMHHFENVGVSRDPSGLDTLKIRDFGNFNSYMDLFCNFNFCLDRSGFSKLVVNSWGPSRLVGWKAISLREKLKKLKGELKRWNVLVFGNLDFRISKFVEQVRLLYSNAKAGHLLWRK